MKDKYYIQCLLRKKITDGCQIKTLWIPEQFAVIGKYVKFKGDDGWQVYKKYSKEEKKIIIESKRDYLKHRLATDI